MSLFEVLKKVRQKGLKELFKAIGRRIHGRIFTTGYDTEVITSLLETILAENGSITLVEVGANVGATDSDPFYKFITANFQKKEEGSLSKNRAILIEPVPELYEQLSSNYQNYQGITCINSAISESSDVKRFYRFREGLDLEAVGLPSFAYQLGSFYKTNITESLPSFDDKCSREAFYKNNVIESDITCATLHEILDAQKVLHVDLLLIDAEGYDYNILKTIDFNKLAPKYINYERTHLGREQAACRCLLLKHGYSLLDHNDDTLCVRNNSSFVENLRQRAYILWLECIY